MAVISAAILLGEKLEGREAAAAEGREAAAAKRREAAAEGRRHLLVLCLG